MNKPSQLAQLASIILVIFSIGCGSDESDPSPGYQYQDKNTNANRNPEESVENMENSSSEIVRQIDDTPPDVEKLAALLSEFFRNNSDRNGQERYLDEIQRLFKVYPDQATLIIDTFINSRKSESKYYFGIAIALVHYLSQRDPVTALKYAVNSEFKGAVDLETPVTALTEQGDAKTLIDSLPLVESPLHRHRMISSIGALANSEQLLDLEDWVEGMSSEDRRILMSGYKPEHYPPFEEFDDWPLKSLLGDAIRPRLARSLALRMENVNNAEDAQTMLNQFENLPGYTEADRVVLEQEWYHRHLQDDQENIVWALKIMHDPNGGIAANAASKVHGEQSGEAAFNLIHQLPDERKKRGMQDFMFAWYRNDSKALSEHLVTLPAGETRRLAALLLARFLERDDHHEEAGQWKRWAENEAK